MTRHDAEEQQAKHTAYWGKGYYTCPALTCMGERNPDMETWIKMEDERGSGRNESRKK
jgi:hypothetical protein